MRTTQIVSVLLISAAGLVYAQSPIVRAPEPSTDLIVKVCTTDFFDRNARCDTRQFLEKRGDDLVFLIQQIGTQEKGELVLTGQLSTKVRPYPLATYSPHSYFLQFPLEVGRKWKGTFEQTSGSNTQTRTRTARVTGYVDLKLKAGTFKAFKIDADNQWSQARRPADESYHYCPDLSMICQYESREFDLKWEVVEVAKSTR
jgi:hypothetical protein